ncbi:hypothetical protein CRE_06296 [Caenorhabditis remanei]|uniref:Uncharacterized protein n=1 Tax=Caenorhabditis remanei TaxID=31234 RepID=E3M127_CAERE|nr:hypothetical protein CRE_06296 [Caenorhabditis remanei]
MENTITTINLWAIDNVVQTVLANQERRESDKIEARMALEERKPAVRLQDGQGSAFTPVTSRRHVFNLEYNQPAGSPPIKPVSGVSEEEDIQKLVLMAKSLLAQLGLLIFPVVQNQVEVEEEAASPTEGNAEKSSQTDNHVLDIEVDAPQNEEKGGEEQEDIDDEEAEMEREQFTDRGEMSPASKTSSTPSAPVPQAEERGEEQKEEGVEEAGMKREELFPNYNQGEMSPVAPPPRTSPIASGPAAPSSPSAPQSPTPTPSAPSAPPASSTSSAPQSSPDPSYAQPPAAPSSPAAPKCPTPTATLPPTYYVQPPSGPSSSSAPQSCSAPTFPPHILEIQRKAAKKNGRRRAEEKQDACRAPNPPLVRDSELYNRRVQEALDYIGGSPVYIDDHFRKLKFLENRLKLVSAFFSEKRRNLFDASNIGEIPQPVCIKAIAAKELYLAWFKVNGKGKSEFSSFWSFIIKRFIGSDWEAIKEENGVDYWEWIGREFEIHDEFVRQVKMGFISAEPMKRKRRAPQQDKDDGLEREDPEYEEEGEDEPGSSTLRPSDGAGHSLRKKRKGNESGDESEEDEEWSRQKELHKKKKTKVGKKPMRSKRAKMDSEEEDMDDSDQDM